MDEAFKKELIEHCKRQLQRFERMERTDSFAYKEHAVLLSFRQAAVCFFFRQRARLLFHMPALCAAPSHA